MGLTTTNTRPAAARATLRLLLGASLLYGFGCGGGDDAGATSSGGCTTDVQCKGDRICQDGKCVDPITRLPDSGDGGSGGNADASGTGGTGGGAAGMVSYAAGSGEIDDPALEQACSKNCEARHAAACSMPIGSLDQCLGQCLVADEQTYGYCLDEMTAQYACLASGGYTCVSGYPQQKATCYSESQAVSTCSQKIPCRMFCERAQGQCAAAGDQCVTECLAKQASFTDAICGVYYGQLLTCWGQSLMCVDGRPAVGSCGAPVAEIADCIGRRQTECDGYCWAADVLGCGSDQCVTDCRAKTDATTSCGSYYRNLVDCTISNNELRLSCTDGAPTPTSACDSAGQQYANCMKTL